MKNLFKNHLLLLACLLLAGHVAAQCPQPLNILQNPDFENIGPPCFPIPPNFTDNGAFNRGCVLNWQAANTTPSICTRVPLASQAHYACLGLNTEGIFQNLVICQGEQYQLTITYRSMSFQPGNFSIYMAQGLVNVPMNDPQGFVIQPNWQLVATVNAGTQWQTVTLPNFTANNLANNQLLILANGGVDIGVDNLSLVCISQITPQFTFTHLGGGQYSFNANSNAMPPMAVVNWCWNFGDGTTATGQNVTHTFAAGGTYNVCLTIQDNCCFCLNTVCQTVIYDSCACGANPQVLNQPGIVNWTNLTQDINNDVIIAPGTHLRVTNSTLNIKNPCKFVVMRGASMNVRTSTLTSDCAPQKWGGIVVWGNSAINHANPPAGTTFSFANPVNNSPNTPGVLLTSLTSTVEHMNNQGIFAQRMASDPINEPIFAGLVGPFNPATQLGLFTGGLARCNSTTFRDNDLSAHFRDYPFNNMSQFGSCIFTTAAPAPQPLSSVGPQGVMIWNTDNISFLNCNFDHVGSRGITTVNGSLTMSRCTLNQNFQGLRASSANGQTGFVQVGLGADNQRNRFIDNRVGIWSDGIFNLNVHTNTFNSNGEIDPVFGALLGGGIFISGASSFEVFDNDFTGNISGAELVNTAGAGPNSLGPNQQFRCNVHEQDRIGMLVRGRCPGMTFRDNAYNNIGPDLAIRRQFFTAGQIHLNQGQSNSAVFNLFSVNAPDITSSLLAGQSILFNYFPPLTENPVVLARAIPDCDINGAGGPPGVPCPNLNNFLNMPASNGVQDPCLVLPPRRQYIPCTDKPCLDALRLEKLYLEQQVNGGQTQYQPQLADVRLRFDTDKRDLAWSWYEQGNMTQIEQLLTEYGTTEDLQMLYEYYVRARNYPTAAPLLESLPATTTEDSWFKDVQRIYLKYASSSGQYVATQEEDQLLRSVGVTTTVPGAQARATYYLLHNVWIEPVIDEGDNSQLRPSSKREATATAEELRIAPNPANDLVTVTVGAGQGGSIRLMNIQGVLVEQLSLVSDAANFATHNLPAGVYVIQHISPEGRTQASRKLIIQH